MFKRNFGMMLMILNFLFLFPLRSADKIAIVIKVIGEVDFERQSAGFKTIKPGSILENGDRLRTGKNGFAAIIFIDDKSTLKIKENSEVIISGSILQNTISKKIRLNQGTLRAQVTPQKKGGFTIQTAVSVASVKGTDFWLLSDALSGDQLIGIEGLVTFYNLISGDSISITIGNTGLSLADGSLDSFVTDPNTIPSDPMGDSGSSNELKIEFQDPAGEKKSLIIEYK
ncbi:MAG: FecR family protein [Candidatus Neomarinimicrobiota bacterium]